MKRHLKGIFGIILGIVSLIIVLDMNFSLAEKLNLAGTGEIIPEAISDSHLRTAVLIMASLGFLLSVLYMKRNKVLGIIGIVLNVSAFTLKFVPIEYFQ